MNSIVLDKRRTNHFVLDTHHIVRDRRRWAGSAVEHQLAARAWDRSDATAQGELIYACGDDVQRAGIFASTNPRDDKTKSTNLELGDLPGQSPPKLVYVHLFD